MWQLQLELTSRQVIVWCLLQWRWAMLHLREHMSIGTQFVLLLTSSHVAREWSFFFWDSDRIDSHFV